MFVEIYIPIYQNFVKLNRKPKTYMCTGSFRAVYKLPNIEKIHFWKFCAVGCFKFHFIHEFRNIPHGINELSISELCKNWIFEIWFFLIPIWKKFELLTSFQSVPHSYIEQLQLYNIAVTKVSFLIKENFRYMLSNLNIA